MLSNQPVLPNFIKTVIFASATVFSISAFAAHHEKGEEKIGDLKDMTTENSTALTAEEKKMLDAKSEHAKSKTKAHNEKVTEEKLMKKAESIVPEK